MMNREGGQAAIGYVWAVGTVAAALTIQIILSTWVQGSHIFLYFVPAVALTAWMAGTLPALVATGLSTLGAAFVLRATLVRGSGPDILGVLLFAVACGALIGILDAQRRTVERDTAMRYGEKVAKAAMAASERHDRTALDNTWDVAIIILDANRTVREWNVGACQITGWARSEMLGRVCDPMYTEAEVLADEPRRQFVLAEASGKLAISRKLRKKDGKDFHAEGAIRPLLDQAGWVSGFLMVFVDASSHVAANEQIEHRLNTRADELESLTYSMAHDMRQYTRGIAMNAKLLMLDHQDSLDQNGLEVLSRLEGNAKRMHEMVEGILEHTKLSRAALNAKPLDLSKTAETSAKVVMQHYDSQSVEFEVQPGLWVRGDADMLELVLNNLFENAAKYSGGKVRFGFDPVKDAYFVRDEGPGFNPEYKEKIFKPFERLHHQDKPGTGIGLSNAKTIIERHGGEMWAVSEGEGKGATFYFSLKRLEEAPVGTLL